MALVTRAATASMDVSTLAFAPQITGLKSGEAIDACSPCYLKSGDGLVYMSNGTAATEPAEFIGFNSRAVSGADQPVTVHGAGARMSYGTGLTPGDKFYIGATAGRLDDAPTTGDAVGVAQAITATDIRVTRSV